MKTAIYPGSFDPITLGHLNIIKRAAVCFDKLIVCVMVNSEKVNRGLFTEAERVELIRRVVAKLPNVEVDSYEGLLVDYARAKGACAIVKGLRAVSDFEFEFQMAQMNRHLDGEVETIFLMPSHKYFYLSSTLIKQVACYDVGRIGEFVPPNVLEALRSVFAGAKA